MEARLELLLINALDTAAELKSLRNNLRKMLSDLRNKSKIIITLAALAIGAGSLKASDCSERRQAEWQAEFDRQQSERQAEWDRRQYEFEQERIQRQNEQRFQDLQDEINRRFDFE